MKNQRTLELKRESKVRAARSSFLAFRKLINPKDKWGWWQIEIAAELQQFYEDMQAGLRPKLVIQAPPQHGKSVQVVDFIAWLAGKNPDCRTIYTSFSERLGVRANLKLQRLYDSDLYADIFPDTRINQSNSVTVSGQFLRNREILEYCDHTGYFRNTTVGGSITGESLSLGVIDDPLKGRKEANSITIRNGVWDWFTDDFFTRFSEDGALLCILTRWHIDDPIGRLLLQYGDGVKLLSYPAIAEHDEPNRKAGEALFPEHKSLDFLLERKGLMDASSWLSLYQQTPIILGGELIKGDWFCRYSIAPKMEYVKIYADTAQKTKEHNDYSVFECWGKGEDGKAYLLDMIRGKWEAPDLRRRAIDFWTKCSERYRVREMCVEDKASGTGLIQDIKRDAKIPIKAIQRNTDKLTRVQDAMPYIESGYVMIPDNAPFVSDFIGECEAFTADNAHDHDDQIDPMCDAIDDMLASSRKAEPRVRFL